MGVIEAAEQSGELKPGQTVIEATSGNTGIGLAMVCAHKGYPLVVTMAEAVQHRAAQADALLGAKVVLTPRGGARVRMVLKPSSSPRRTVGSLPASSRTKPMLTFHSRTTAREIVDDFKGEKLDYWVTGYGTGGTLKGVSRRVAKEMPNTKIIVCEPEDAQLSGSGIKQARNPDGSPSSPHPAFKPHPMQGWTPDFIPKTHRRCRCDERDRRIVHIPGAEGSMEPESSPRRKVSSSASVRGNLCRRVEGPADARNRREHPLHASRHRRALSEHAVVC